MLIGEYQHSFDEKGRIIIPARFREDLGQTFVVTKGMDSALALYSKKEWERLEAKVRALPSLKSRKLQLFLFSGATEVEPDKQGRIVIPQNLRSYANLQRDAVVIGSSDHAEIWDRERWNEAAGELTAEMVAEAMSELDF